MALAIKRKAKESFWVGEAKITIWEVSDGTVKLSIEAPEHVKIIRSELLNAKEIEAVTKAIDA